MTFSGRVTARGIGVLLASLSLTLLVAEVATRALSNVTPPLDHDDPVVGKTYAPGFAGSVYVDECDCDVFLRFNREGFRGPDRAHRASEATRRVALVGDSMVASIATDEVRTAAHVSELLLNTDRATTVDHVPSLPLPDTAQYARSRWEVMNFGVSGSSTAQQLVLYRERIRTYRPDVVVLAFFLRNDVTDNSPRLGHSPRIFFDFDSQGSLVRHPAPVAHERSNEWLNRNSRFYVWQKTMLARLNGRWGRVDRSRLVYLQDPHGDIAHAWALTEALLQTFRDEVTADGARFIVVALAPAELVYEDVWADLLQRAGAAAHAIERDAPERRLREICSSARIPFISTTPALRAAAHHATSSVRDEQLYWQGIGHLNARGNAVVANLIADTVRAHVPRQ